MSQPNNDIFPKEEKEAAKRKKIAEMEAVTAQAILKIILAQAGVELEQYHRIKYCVLIIPIGNSGIEISLSDSDVINRKKSI